MRKQHRSVRMPLLLSRLSKVMKMKRDSLEAPFRPSPKCRATEKKRARTITSYRTKTSESRYYRRIAEVKLSFWKIDKKLLKIFGQINYNRIRRHSSMFQVSFAVMEAEIYLMALRGDIANFNARALVRYPQLHSLRYLDSTAYAITPVWCSHR